MKKTVLRILYDTAMAVIMLMLMVYSLTGGFLHESFGLVILVMFTAHKIFNFKWIAAVTKKIFSSGTDGLTMAKYITDTVLLLLMIITGFSGILISNNLLTGVSANNRILWVNIHNISAYSMFIVISIHIGLHWSFIMAVFRKMLGLKDNVFRKIILRICAAVLAVFGVKAHFNQEFLMHFIPQEYDTDSQNQKLYDADTATDTVNLSSSEQPQIAQLRRGHHGHSGEEQQDTVIAPQPFEGGETPTLEEYLGNLYCTGCRNHCPLISPQCGTGVQQAQLAEEQYNSQFGEQTITQEKTTENETVTSAPQIPNDKTPTLEEYLGNLYCTGCRNHCPLISPQCGTGVQQAQLAEEQYNSQFGEQTITQEKTTEGETVTSAPQIPNDKTPTLEEYLGNLYCTGCRNHCPLISPQCGKGMEKARQAENEYKTLYGNYEENTSYSENEIIFDDNDHLKKLFTTMIPVMSLYICGTHYVVKFAKRKRK